MKWKGEWHGGWDVVKETEKTLVLDDNTILLKSTIHMIEDVIYLSNRSGSTYFCADDPSTLDMQVALRDIEYKERCERNTRNVMGMLEPPDTSYLSRLEQREGKTKEEWENRIFGEDTVGDKNDSV